MTAEGWLLIVAAVVLAAGGYRYSLWRHPMRNCHHCTAWGKHRGWLWSYATGDCKARTVMPPRTQCDGGRVPRWGVRVLRLEDKGK
jgi:hypothetical protein